MTASGQQVSAGALEFAWVPSGLRHIRFGGTEVLAGAQLVVRDPSWPQVPEAAGPARTAACRCRKPCHCR